MKAITIQQPWAWAVIYGGKSVENRTRIGTWLPAIGQTVLVHVGKRWSERGGDSWDVRRALVGDEIGYEADDSAVWAMDLIEPADARFDFGAIIGQVDVEDVHPAAGCCAPWGEASYVQVGGTKRVDIVHLVLANPQPIRPYPMTGRLGLWTVDDETVKDMAR